MPSHVSAWATKPRALELLRQGIAAVPNTRDFHHNLAFILLAENQPEEALENVLLALESTPDDANLRRTVERAQNAVLQKARKLLRGVPDKQRNATNRAPAYRALMERYERAEEAIKEKGEKGKGKRRDTNTTIRDQQSKSILFPLPVHDRQERGAVSAAIVLESAKDFVDEIVIVDTGSTDGTFDIAREYGAKIVNYAWNDDFCRGAQPVSATCDRKLGVVAGRGRGDCAGQRAVHSERPCKARPEHVGGYMVTFHNWLTSATRPAGGQEMGGEMAVHHACRLFRRVEGVKFEGRIHEQNLRSLQAFGYTYARMDGLLH